MEVDGDAMNDLISDYAAVKCSPGGDWYERPKRRKQMATKRRVKKQSGNRAASIAATWLRRCQAYGRGGQVTLPVATLKTLCASVLSQDETKGKRK